MQQIFDLETEAPEVWKAVSAECPAAADACRALPDELLRASCAPFMGRDLYRLSRHARSICQPVGSPGKKTFDRPVLIYKGAEPMLPDFEDFLRKLSRTGFRGERLRSVVEHFPLVESKVAGVCLLNEILLETRASLEFQRDFVQARGRLARVPTPLKCWKHDERFLDKVRALLSSTSYRYVWSKMETALSLGMGLGVFYYPAAPLRADFLTPQNEELLAEHSDGRPRKSELTRAWLTLTADMLSLNFLPSTILSWNMGACTDAGNACIDGGLCDMDSVTRIEAEHDDQFVYESLHSFVSNFSATLVPFLGLATTTGSGPYAVYRMIVGELAELLRAPERRSRPVDDRILRFLGVSRLEDAVKLFVHSRLDGHQLP